MTRTRWRRTRSARQGRSGQAGRQVARLLGAILDPAARRRGFAEASLLADWATIVGPVAGTALPAAARRPCARPAPAAARCCCRRAAAPRSSCSMGAAADRADQHLFRPSRHPPAPAAADAAAAASAATAAANRAVARRRTRRRSRPASPRSTDDGLREALLALGRTVRAARGRDAVRLARAHGTDPIARGLDLFLGGCSTMRLLPLRFAAGCVLALLCLGAGLALAADLGEPGHRRCRRRRSRSSSTPRSPARTARRSTPRRCPS